MLPSVLTGSDDRELPGHEQTQEETFASPRPVVVGIDGSKSAVQAAIWATGEAMQRGTFLRLVHVITDHPQSRDRGYAHAGQVLHKATKAVHAVSESVMVDSDVLEGDLATKLAEAADGAEMICLGSTQPDSVAAELCRRSCAPVMVMGHGPPRWFGRRNRGRGRRGPSAMPINACGPIEC